MKAMELGGVVNGEEIRQRIRRRYQEMMVQSTEDEATTEGLDHCPFCGDEAQAGFLGEDGLYRVMCNGCSAQTTEATEDEAIAAWNRRYDS